jgi:hypothetical protein
MRHTYLREYRARLLDADDTDCGTVIVPDAVAADQRVWDGRRIPAKDAKGYLVRVRLDGAAYGLWTSGTGDMVVRLA